MIGITGSSGFVGQNLLHYWQVSNQQKKFKSWNRIKDGTFLKQFNIQEFFSENRFEKFIHLAWYSNSNLDYRESESNFIFLNASFYALEICKKLNIPFFTIGSLLANSEDSTKYGVSKLRLINEVLNYSKGTVYIPGYLFSIKHQRPRILKEFLQSRENFVLQNPTDQLPYQEICDCVYEISDLITTNQYGLYTAKSFKLISNAEFIFRIGKRINESINSQIIDYGMETTKTLGA